ncbi:hypothetical protein CAPTEDRAFT_186754 [Capitella teleta]|uniref:Uncharacterized protein n=1 Tax=Capitella teleta TaxID=283909 RepID=R7VM77_CAPTE|nr:hypothetical protein CAPTEDRAFT_186754 [Capitella teleta]|eukprot:ELU18360.1 hypothetical protein CAPTEDRAFT_186754 [Capitella teleta]
MLEPMKGYVGDYGEKMDEEKDLDEEKDPEMKPLLDRGIDLSNDPFTRFTPIDMRNMTWSEIYWTLFPNGYKAELKKSMKIGVPMNWHFIVYWAFIPDTIKSESLRVIGMPQLIRRRNNVTSTFSI